MTRYSQVVQDLLDGYRSVWALIYSSSVLRWDLETYMPKEGSAARGQALAELTLQVQQKLLSMRPLIERASSSDGLTDVEKGITRVLGRRLKYYTNVPSSLVEDLQKTTTEARVAWREARQKSDFRLFQPHLEKVLRLKMMEGEKLAEGGDPYDALLDQGEEGLTSADLDTLFNKIIPPLKRIFQKVQEAGDPPSSHPLEEERFDRQLIMATNEEVVSVLGMPLNRFRVDLSAHPFTSGFDVDDVRITTRYGEKDFRTTVYATIHESGHALYELQVGRELRATPIGHGVSSGFHESQSRFWENIVGRSREFVRRLTPVYHKTLPFTQKYDYEDLYRYSNLVRPSLIRVDADEVTYNLHIALRYGIERKLFDGKASVDEVPQLWSETSEELLGVRPGNDSNGSLQDIHWSSGGFASFPNYTIGNVIAGMCWEAINREMNMSDVIAAGQIERLKEWLREKIHKYGGTYSPRELQQKTFAKVYDPSGLINYLESKYIAR
jgi:carboxypeptidase Taq